MATETETTEKILSLDDILSADDLGQSTIKIAVPEWGGTVLFRPMTGEEAVLFQSQLSSGKKNDAWLHIFARCAVDQAGNRLFPTPSHVDKLRKKSVKTFLRLQHQLMYLNGMGRGEKTWDALLPILEEAGVDAAVIAKVEARWTTPETDAKND